MPPGRASAAPAAPRASPSKVNFNKILLFQLYSTAGAFPLQISNVMKAHGAYRPKVNHLYLYLYFIRINKLRRARFCARGGKLNIANACIYARASYFRQAPRVEIACPRMHALAPTPLSLLPSPPSLPFLSPLSLSSPSLLTSLPPLSPSSSLSLPPAAR